MKKRTFLLIAIITGFVVMLTTAGIFAASTTVSDEIKMENSAYAKHKKGIVMFSHKKHASEYAEKNPDLYKNGCGECHHDKDGKPLTINEGDSVQGCIECHTEPSEPPKGKDAPKLSKEEKMKYHAHALHENCKGCHKAFKDATGSKAAPTTCTKCHPKKKK